MDLSSFIFVPLITVSFSMQSQQHKIASPWQTPGLGAGAFATRFPPGY